MTLINWQMRLTYSRLYKAALVSKRVNKQKQRAKQRAATEEAVAAAEEDDDMPVD